MARSNHVIKTIAGESALTFHLGPFSPSFLEIKILLHELSIKREKSDGIFVCPV